MINGWTKKLEALDAERIALGTALGWLVEAAEAYAVDQSYSDNDRLVARMITKAEGQELCDALKNAREVFSAWP